MNRVELSKAYNPKDFEDHIYRQWEAEHLFAPKESPKDPYVIVIPPPNVTGVLHMGHGLNNSLQDILIRYHRMTGKPTLWLPGTDHAGIATQNVVDRMLRERGIDRYELGREKFLEETWQVKERHQSTIINQLKRIGSSCDWSRERFTLDEGLSRAVREVFVSLYEKGLVYRENYLVNWCVSCGTALSDDEVEHREISGTLTKIRYPFSDGSGAIEIATTRPETMLGDTAVAVHPEDERYSGIIGKMLTLPLTGREIPIIADSYVSMEFGTGMVKVTPAHDPNDWDIGRRHDLDQINILNADGTLSSEVPERYQGLSVLDARKLVIEDLKKQEYFIADQDHGHQVGHCYRCDSVIEPYLSEQWFVSMRSMADKALTAWERGEVQFFPKRWENTYIHWLKNIRDWCISRQLWWGHRIPVWYCRFCGRELVSREDITSCSYCGSEDLRQDEDVLDTWFSSWLWPFSTLGWPDDTEDLRTFFPTTTLVTGYDIIFFWVARMIMASLEFMGEVPFRDIYITGLVRDIQGRKMSKSTGNGIDPIEVVDSFGADAMRFTLGFLAAQGQDVLINMDSFKLGSRFCNKIWNAARFILMNLEGADLVEDPELRDMDRWVYHRLNETAADVAAAFTSYRFNDASQAVYEFFWNDVCDWYVEASKPSFYSSDSAERSRAVSIMLDILAESLRLLHPFIPFITEEIYQKLPNTEGFLIEAPYPVCRKEQLNKEIASHVEKLQDAVRGIRTLRSEFTIPPEKKINTVIRTDKDFSAKDFFQANKELIVEFINADFLEITDTVEDASGSVPVSGLGYEAYVFIRDSIDVQQELRKLEKERQQLTGQLAGVKKKLANEQFLSRAPREVIDKEQGKQAEFEERLEKISRYLQDLN